MFSYMYTKYYYNTECLVSFGSSAYLFGVIISVIVVFTSVSGVKFGDQGLQQQLSVIVLKVIVRNISLYYVQQSYTFHPWFVLVGVLDILVDFLG